MKCKNCGAELNNGKCQYCGATCFEGMYYLPIVDIDGDAIYRALHKKPSFFTKVETVEITTLSDSEPIYVRGK